MGFRYVEDADSCGATVEDEDVPCDVCGSQDNGAYAGSQFSTSRDVNAVCAECIEKGLPDWITMGRGGDSDKLRRQLAELHPTWSAEQLESDYRAKYRILSRHTPPIMSWQEWFWPACCGDYCRFVQHAGRKELEKLAQRSDFVDGPSLLAASLVDPEPRGVKLWDVLPKSVHGPDSNESPQTYVFLCETCHRLRITWDSD